MMNSLARRLKEKAEDLKEKVEDKVDKKLHGLKWKGTIELETKNIFCQIAPDLCDVLHDLVGKTVQFELVGGIDPETGNANQSGKERMKCRPQMNIAEGLKYTVGFKVKKDFGEPAALLVESHHSNEFFLKHVTLRCAHYPPSEFEFPCHSWVYNHKNYDSCPRIFFSNKAYLPSKTPIGLQKWRHEALQQLRGESGNPEGVNSERKDHDRVYDYDVYNDLGNPESSKGDQDLRRKVLGGSAELPYPRRCRTGRKLTYPDRLSEVPVPDNMKIYVPRDEQFDSTKEGGFNFDKFKSFLPHILPTIKEKMLQPGCVSNRISSSKFSSLCQIFKLYSLKSKDQGSGSLTSKLLELGESVQLISTMVKQLLEDPIGYFLNFSEPQIIQAPGIQTSKEWKADEEFGRQTLAGINPLAIERVKEELPRNSRLSSALNGRTLEDELSVEEAIAQNRLYIVDYHDAFLPYVKKANQLDDSKVYACRTVFFLTKDGTLKPVAIELSVSDEDDGVSSRVFFPPAHKEEGWLWHLAKAHATINDTAYHELISHWLRTHACMEPFIIATHRTLSALHPINVLLAPHFKDTLQINSFARQILINAHKEDTLSGIIEMGFCTDRYSMEFSSNVYKTTWRFDEQALPRDLIKRGMAVQDPNAKYNLRLYIEDYPYAVDGLEIWFAIKSWVNEYLSIYYVNDMEVENDSELQSWWLEIQENGHGDKKNENWWVKMRTKEELEEVIVTVIWIASAHHAAVNFGQYAYGGFMPNRPTRASKLIPDEGTQEYNNLLTDSRETFYLESLSNQKQATIVMATLEILSNHSSNEEYLGQRNTRGWTSNEKVLQAFNKFTNCIQDIENNINKRNGDPKLKNRHGLVRVPYTLLIPTSSPGLTGRGIPNSISI